MSIPTKEQLKARSKNLSKLLQEKYNLKVSHGHCLDLVAQLFGFKDWNTANSACPQDENAEAEVDNRYALAEAIIQGFQISIEQPYKVEKYFSGGATAQHASEQGVIMIDRFSVRKDQNNRKLIFVMPQQSRTAASDSVVRMHKQTYLQREKFFAEKLGGKAENLGRD